MHLSRLPFISLAAPFIYLATPFISLAAPFISLATPFISLATPFISLATPFISLAAPFISLATPFISLDCHSRRHAQVLCGGGDGLQQLRRRLDGRAGVSRRRPEAHHLQPYAPLDAGMRVLRHGCSGPRAGIGLSRHEPARRNPCR
jgi:hypothetical protein